MIHIIYSLFIRLLGLFFWVAQWFSPRAKRWREDRSNQAILFKNLQEHKGAIWFHVSSLGELEQAYPLIANLKGKNHKIVVSFFSHSGFDQAYKYKHIDYAFLLPLDLKSNALNIIKNLNPKMVVWVKNEFWFNFLQEITLQNIPLIFISVSIGSSHFLTKFYSQGFRNILKKSKQLFIQDEISFTILKELEFENIMLSGDTRITRVKNRKKASENNLHFQKFKGRSTLIIFGSIHHSDMPIVNKFITNNPDFKYLLFPHHIDDKTIKSLFSNVNYNFSLTNQLDEAITNNVLVINKLGVLFNSYQHADFVYIGGGFSEGIHNILEPTVFLKPVYIGPKHSKFNEARALINLGCVAEVSNHSDMTISITQYLKNPQTLLKLEHDLKNFYLQYPDPVNKILDYCESNQLV